MPSPKKKSVAALNTVDAARYVGLAPGTLEKHRIYGNRGPHWVRLGGAIRYRVVDLDAWLARNVQRPGELRDQDPGKPSRGPARRK